MLRTLACVDLTVTAAGEVILDNTAAGLVVVEGAANEVDGASGEPYLAEISDAGVILRLGPVPAHDGLAVSGEGGWVAWSEPGTTGGEVTSIPTLQAQAVDGTRQATLTAPDGWLFLARSWALESEDFLVSPVIGDGGDGSSGERLVRCSVESATCVLTQAR